MKRSLIFLYGVVSYALFFATFLYSIGFIGNIGVPKSIDSAPILKPWASLAIDLGLLSLFALQHSGMARPTFKRWLTRFVPPQAERSTYVLMSTICLALLMCFWAPLGGVIWNVTSRGGVWTLTGLYFASWGLLLYATFLLNHFELFGLRQSYDAFMDRVTPPLEFRTPALYRLIRHPINTGWLGIVWFTPTMTVTHLVFAALSTAYIFVGIKLEERDLEAAHPEYTQYKAKVPALLPSPTRRLRADSAVQGA